eukprot:TRINITY_DN3727_c0_g4_i2.p1 TRINITY_DN3727_c0_g4~~TRINITY_DN3727_c0_g4_i2.p1  ORF type:complete len:228 (-),score=45.33 TRINITY_DN3727_c0_g4_i2:290-973(-)
MRAHMCVIDGREGREGQLPTMGNIATEDEQAKALQKEEEGLWKWTKQRLNSLIADPLLSDLPTNPSLSDVETLLALEKGSALKLHVKRFDGNRIDLVVQQNATVKDVMKVIERTVDGGRIKSLPSSFHRISWKYIWSEFGLSLKGQNFTSASSVEMTLEELGVVNGDSFSFCHRPRMEGRKHSGAKLHAKAKRRRIRGGCGGRHVDSKGREEGEVEGGDGAGVDRQR